MLVFLRSVINIHYNSLNSQILRYAQHLLSVINCVLYGEYVQRVQRICVVTYIACRIQTKAQRIMSEKKVISRGIELRTDGEDLWISKSSEHFVRISPLDRLSIRSRHLAKYHGSHENVV